MGVADPGPQGGVVPVEVALVLSRSDEADPAVQAPVVGPVDVPTSWEVPLGDGDPQVFDALPGPLV
jgi:hypothetical protein